MKKWMWILCITMGLLFLVGVVFIGAGLQRENTPQGKLRRELRQENAATDVAWACPPVQQPVGEAAHV